MMALNVFKRIFSPLFSSFNDTWKTYICLMKKIYLLLLYPLTLSAQPISKTDVQKWEQQAMHVTIIRDHYGVPHIYGKTDADAVFGLLYAQCEDDFYRVELNYIEKLGRLSEVNGDKDLYNDLLIRMIIDTTEAKLDYETSPFWLKKLCNAFADGINYYLYTHQDVKPKLLNKFEPWYPLLWTDGSIGAISIADISVDELQNFYGGTAIPITKRQVELETPTGSNGFAFAPSITASHHAILYINPHVTFYFRPEVHVVSEEGLNAYGAVTWGQFFVYQGFNEHCGWMHTSSYTDVSDAYIETVTKNDDQYYYQYDHTEKKVIQKKIEIAYKDGQDVSTKSFTTFYTGHGPVMAIRDGHWISVKSNNRDIKGLIQSWQRTKAKSFEEYKEVMNLLANTSNNTDAEGNIAYWHGNFIPIRDTNYDWSKPVDGTVSATEWKGLHSVNESVHIYNPPNGWLENCNSTPYTAAGAYSPRKENYPPYMAPDGQNFRGINALRILGNEHSYTLDKVIEKGYDTYLAAFEILIPALIKAYDKTPYQNGSSKTSLADPMAIIKKWDYHCGENSIATTLAVYWGEKLLPAIFKTSVIEDEENDIVQKTKLFAADASAQTLLSAFAETVETLKSTFGKWDIPWGDINRFQRIGNNMNEHFDDTAPSYPVAFASSTWGMIPSYSSRSFPGTLKRYGVNGNSFICAVEFGDKIKAKSLLAGGESGDIKSPHFFDQGWMYAKGQFKDVLFYKDDVLKNAEKQYHPGEMK